MRCVCCNRNLSDYESTLKHPVTNDYLDMCNKCLEDVPIEAIEGSCPENSSYYDEADDHYEDALITFINEEDDER